LYCPPIAFTIKVSGTACNSQNAGLQLAERVKELLAHHVQRSAAIIEILRTGPKTAEELAREHFEERLLEGFGSIMAANEIVSHCDYYPPAEILLM